MSLVVCLGGLLLVASPGSQLARAHQLADDLDFAQAAQVLAQAQTAPGQTRAQVLELARLQGQVLGALGKSDAAVAAFERLLWLQPDAELTADTSPRVQTAFLEARTWLADHGPLQIRAAPPGFEGPRVTSVAVELGADALGLQRQLRFHLRRADDWDSHTVEAKPGVCVLPIQPAESLDWWAELLGPSGEVLGAVADASAPDHAGVVHGWSARSAAPFAAAGAGGALLTAGAVTGLLARSTNSQIEGATIGSRGVVTGLTQRQAFDLESRANTEALTANVLFAVGSAAVLTGAALFLLAPDAR